MSVCVCVCVCVSVCVSFSGIKKAKRFDANNGPSSSLKKHLTVKENVSPTTDVREKTKRHFGSRPSNQR